MSPVFPYLGKTSVKLLRDRRDPGNFILSRASVARVTKILVNDHGNNDWNEKLSDRSFAFSFFFANFFSPRIYSHGSNKQNVLPLSGKTRSRGKKNTTIHARKSLTLRIRVLVYSGGALCRHVRGC